MKGLLTQPIEIYIDGIVKVLTVDIVEGDENLIGTEGAEPEGTE